MTEHAVAVPEGLLHLLQKGTPAILCNVGADGWPNAVTTWAAARDPHHIRFGVDLGTTTHANLERTGMASLHIIGPDNLIFLVKGTARVLKRRLECLPPPHLMSMMEMTPHAVKDQAWVGVVVSPLSYRWVGQDADRMAAAEREVLAELREWEA